MEALDKRDGEAIGIAFNLQKTIERKLASWRGRWNGVHVRVSVDKVIEDHLALRELMGVYPWLKLFMEGILDTHLAVPTPIRAKLLNLSSREANTIGRKLSNSLKAKKTAEAGVDQWMLLHPAMVEMGKTYDFFIPMIVTIGRQKVIDAPWGMKFRLYFGAFISLLDMFTDIQAIVRFFEEGRDGFAWTNLSFIGVCLILQLLVVYGQNKKRGKRIVAYEMLIVVSMLKPAMDAGRVASGNVHEEGALLDPSTELTLTKCIEMFSESIPSSIIQTYALLDSKETKVGALGSIAVSAVAIAYASTTISMDMDTSPSKRLIAPKFYGYVPDTNRLQVMVLMALMTTAHVLLKVLACALMLRLSSVWFMIYLAGDMGLFFIIKKGFGQFNSFINGGSLRR